MFKNTQQKYGLIAIFLHWVTVVGVIFLFSLGLWMDGLGYYDSYYRLAPHIHKSVGVLLMFLVAARLLWKMVNKSPQPLSSHAKWEINLARLVHWLFYLLLFSMLVSGYLITTAKGDSLQIFNWFSLPAIIDSQSNMEDLAGEIHKFLAFTLIALALLHAAAAFKHHFIEKDSTLKRMLGRGQ